MRRGVSGEVEESSAEGWARDAWGGMSRDWPKKVGGRGVWVARDGLERRRTLRERECGLVEWALDWAMVGVVVLSLVDRWVSASVLVDWILSLS